MERSSDPNGSPPDLILRRCRLEGRSAPADVAIGGGVITSVGARLGASGRAEFDAGGRLVTPSFVQPHIHLDKAGTLPLLGSNRSGTLAEAIDILHRVKRSASADDVATGHRARQKPSAMSAEGDIPVSWPGVAVATLGGFMSARPSG